MKLKYRIERMQLMVLHDLNVPDFIENVYTLYGKGAVFVVSDIFRDVSSFRVLSNVPGGRVETDVSYKTVASACSNCVVEKEGYSTWLMCDDTLCEYEGTIWVGRKGAGRLKYNGMYKDRFVFQDFEALPSIRLKIIVRRVYKFLRENPWMEAIAMDFGWAKQFCGSKSERIIFFDFLPIKEIP